MGRNAIERLELITPGPDGRVYVTPDEYDSGSKAQAKLALPLKPAGYYEIPNSRLEGLSKLAPVDEKYGEPGGGSEQYVARPVDASGLNWVSITP